MVSINVKSRVGVNNGVVPPRLWEAVSDKCLNSEVVIFSTCRRCSVIDQVIPSYCCILPSDWPEWLYSSIQAQLYGSTHAQGCCPCKEQISDLRVQGRVWSSYFQGVIEDLLLGILHMLLELHLLYKGQAKLIRYMCVREGDVWLSGREAFYTYFKNWCFLAYCQNRGWGKRHLQ